MRRFFLAAVLGTALLVAACDDPTGRDRANTVTVMTRNLYLGTDVGEVLGQTNPQLIPIEVWKAYTEVQQSQPAERMARIADEIAAARPELVGLQEVSQFYTQSPSDFLTSPAGDLQYDFLTLLVAALEERGMDYVVAASVTNAQFEFPAVPVDATGPRPDQAYDVRVVDRDVILVRADVQYRNPTGGTFAARVPINLGGLSLPYLRGWVSVDARVNGRELRFINTHLETQGAPPVNEAQAQELSAIALASPLPVIMLGDFNSAANASAPDRAKTAAYPFLTQNFTDLWAELYTADSGETCCHAEDLRNSLPALDERIDQIFYRGDLRGVSATVVGDEPADRTASGLWPSDHAGVVGRIRVR